MRVLWIVVISWIGACGGGGDDKLEDCVPEIPYDGVDQDCSGFDLVDVDRDGFDGGEDGTDCNDDDVDVYPGAEEVAYDGIDQDCSGADLLDADGDGFDAAAEGGDDCDDTDASVFPGSYDPYGDDRDQDCDGTDGIDLDQDGFASEVTGGPDCDDNDAAIHPDAVEVYYDGIDQNCDRQCDYDADDDGYVIEDYVPADNGGCDTDPEVGEIGYAPDCNDDDNGASENFLVRLVPEDGDTDVFNLLPIQAQLTVEELGATLSVTAGGTSIPGTVWWDASNLVFSPDAALPPNTTLIAEVNWSCGRELWSFTSGAYGSPVNPGDPIDKSYVVDLSAGTWVEPAGVGSLIGLLLELDWLIGVAQADASTITFLQAVTEQGTDQQDVCVETLLLPPADFTSNPLFVVGPTEVTFSLFGFDAMVTSAILGGEVSSDSSQLQGMVLTGNLDTRPLVDLVFPGAPDDAVCDLGLGFGAPCLPCPDGTGSFCYSVIVDDLVGTEVVGQTLIPRDLADISADPFCL